LPVLDGIDVAIPDGGIVALIGPNGCGKSTLLRVVAGLLRPGSGEALLDNTRIDGPDPRIGLVFQEPRLLPWRSAADNITYPLELAGWSLDRRAERLAALTALVGLDPAMATRILHAAAGTPMELPCAIALATGMRRGEILALRWADLDETLTVAHVRRSLQVSGEGLGFVEPKTRRSRRAVALPGFLRPYLERQRISQGLRRAGSRHAARDQLVSSHAPRSG